MNAANPCRCSKKATTFLRNGWLHPTRRHFTAERLAAVREVAPDRLGELETLDRAHAEIHRDTPFVDAAAVRARIRAVLAESEFFVITRRHLSQFDAEFFRSKV